MTAYVEQLELPFEPSADRRLSAEPPAQEQQTDDDELELEEGP